MRIIQLLSLWLCFAALAVATVTPPYGDAKFEPTTETPIGFRADGNGWYPGATPPVEWWEGTPKQVMMKSSTNNDGTISPTAKPSPTWAVGDTKSKNIRWKSPIPGWGDAQPILVKGKLITIGDPDFVICYDADTGKVLWQDRLQVMTLPVLGKDRKTIGQIPEEKTAAAEQTAWELARAMYLFRVQGGSAGIGAGGTDAKVFSEEGWPQQRPVIEKLAARAKEWRALLPDTLPAPIVQGMDGVATTMQGILDAKDADTRVKLWTAFNKDTYTAAVLRAFHATTNIGWQGFMSGAFSSPVSDGEIVVVCFAYGQFAGYDVATGKRLWAWRDSQVPGWQMVNHGASPLMYKDLVLVRSGDGQAIMGLDKKTGAVRWETQIQMQKRGMGANHGNYITPVLLNLPVTEGGTKMVLVTQEPPVLDAETGAVLGRLEIGGPKKRSDRGTMVGHDDFLATGWGYDAASSPTYRFRLSLKQGALQVEHLGNLSTDKATGLYGGTALLYRPGGCLGDAARLYDPATGILLSQPGGQGGESTPAVQAGDIIISPFAMNSFNRTLESFNATARFNVIDATDLRAPRTLSNRNLLDGADLPADYIWDTYMQGFDKRRNIGCYKGIAPWFGNRVGGVMVRGDRVYIQGTLGMYCIAPEVSGSLKDDVAVVAAIAAETDVEKLAKYLTETQPRYRHDALLRLIAQKAQLNAETAATITKLVTDDPYEEVRAAAVQALDACDPKGKAGWTAYTTALKPVESAIYTYNVDNVNRWHDHVLTIRAMGDAGAKYIAREIPTVTDEVLKRALIHVASELRLKDEAITDAALAMLKTLDGNRNRMPIPLIAGYLGNVAFEDPRSIPALRTFLGNSGGEGQTTIFSSMVNRLPIADLKVFLEENCRKSASIGAYAWPEIQRGWQRVGADAIPILEKIIVDLPDAKAKLQPIIDDMKTPPLNPLAK